MATMHSSISEQLARQSVVPMESTIPPDMTVAEWRRRRPSGARPKRRYPARRLAATPRLAAVPTAPCDHLYDSTTRYDHDRKLLTFLLVCPVCATEKVMETQHYEPRFQPSPECRLEEATVGATVHQLTPAQQLPRRRAA